MATSRLPKKKSRRASGKQGSALDAEQAALLEQQRAVQEQIDALQRTIEEEPKRLAAQRQQQSEAYLTGPHGPRAHYRHAATMAGVSYLESPSMASRPKRRSKRAVLRAEKAEGRIQTVALVIALLIAVGWLASRYF